MDFIYRSYFKHNPYPSLILKPDLDSSYKIYDANDAFIDIMQIDKNSILDKDIFESFLGDERNVATVVSSIIKTSLAYVRTFWIPKKNRKIAYRIV